MTNVPHLVIFYAPTGYSFGYFGKGPLDLALSICEWYLQQAGYSGPRTDHWSGTSCDYGDCFEMSFALHREFLADFIEKAPKKETIIPFADLKQWFDQRL